MIHQLRYMQQMIQVQNNNKMYIAEICRNRTTSQVLFLAVPCHINEINIQESDWSSD